jgi:ABC-type antimicrobial peptide transport system permease subunit
LVLGEGGRVVLLGIALGTVAVLLLGRLMAGLLYGISSANPLALITAAALLILVAFVACYVPARRAMQVELLISLRFE